MLTERNNVCALAGCVECSLNTATAAVMLPLLHVKHTTEPASCRQTRARIHRRVYALLYAYDASASSTEHQGCV